MTPLVLLITALAGGVGAVSRFELDALISRRLTSRVPLGTLVINVTGSFLLGLLAALAAEHAGTWVLPALGTGFLGGYTTFSAASVEAVRIATADDDSAAGRRALAHAGGMLVLGVAAAALGVWLGSS